MSGTEVEAEEVQADFLFLRELGQGASSVRLSEPLSIENSESSVNLICVSNSNGILFAATNQGFIAHRLSDIRQLCSSSSRKDLPKIDNPLRFVDTVGNVALEARVSFLRFGQNEEKLVVGMSNGRIAIWSIAELVQREAGPNTILQPPSNGLSLLELAPNPSDRPELCIALYGTSDKQKLRAGTAVVFNLQTGQWASELRPSSGASTTSLCWSVKGKQVVLGLDDGNLIQMTPEGQEKDSIPRPSGLEGTPYIEQVMWLENHVFFVTYNQPPNPDDAEPVHQYETYTILRDSASKTFVYTHFTDPAAPFGDTARRGHRYAAWLKGWEPTKHMLFVANTSSTEVGLLGSMTKDNQWHNLDLEDTSRPTLPFSSLDQSADTSPVGLDLDLTGESNVDDPQAAIRGEDGEGKLPPMPVLYVYTTDGMLLAYTVVNVDSAAGTYPSMGKGISTIQAEPAATECTMQTDMADITTPSKPNTSTAAFTTTPASSTSTPGFAQSTGFGGFGSTPAFGQSASIGNKSPSPFSFNPSASTTSSTTPIATPAASTGGFGAFASKPSNAFGTSSTSFSFGTPQSTSTTTSGITASTSTPAATPAFGGTTSTAPAPAFGAPAKSAFGQVSATPAFGSSSTFGSSATAFGQPSAFGSASTTQKSPFAPASSSNNAFSTPTSTSTSGFGGFASKASTFGAPPANNDGDQSTSIFGVGGSLQTKDSKTPAPVFGQSASQKSGSLFASNATSAKKGDDEMEEEKGDAGSLSFGGLGGLLGDDSQSKASKFTFGSKQDATFSTTPTPSPFSFAKPKEVEAKASEGIDAFKAAPREASREVPKMTSAFGTTSANPSFAASTTPTASPEKKAANGEIVKPAILTNSEVRVKQESEEVTLADQSELIDVSTEVNEEVEQGDSQEVGGDDEEGSELDEIDEEEEESEEEEEEEEEVSDEEGQQKEEDKEATPPPKEVIPSEVKQPAVKAPVAVKEALRPRKSPEVASSTPVPKEVPRPQITPKKIPDAEELVKGSLQDLFLQTYLTMEKELTVLKESTQRRKEHQVMLRESSEKALSLQDLSDESKWTFGDLETKLKLTQDLIATVETMASSTQNLRLSLKEIQSSQLKVDIKREEIARFIRARNDPSFGRLVRIRQLGPEHADNQSKLRRATSTVREGIEELELFIEKARKMTLEEQSGSGQGTLRAPSLDTIRRTARNIMQSAQVRLIELQELQLSYDQITMNKPISTRSNNEGSILMEDEEDDESNVFDSIRKLERALPKSESIRGYNRDPTQESGDGKGDAHGLRAKQLELRSVFLSGWEEPILNKVMKDQDTASEAFQLSDLNMAFAKGPIRVTTSKPALKSPPLKFASSQNGASEADSATSSIFSYFTKPVDGIATKKKDEAAPFSFSPLSISSLPKNAFQLPPEEVPFAPGGSVANASRGHHVNKYGGKRNTAVALPSTQTSTGVSSDVKSKADFFAMPSSTAQTGKNNGSSSPSFATSSPATSANTIKAPFTGFSGFGSSALGFGNSSQLKSTKPSTPSPLASRLGPVTFQGLQPMKPINKAPPVVYDDDDDSSSEEENNGRRASDDDQAQGEEVEGEYEDEDGNGEEGYGDEKGEEHPDEYGKEAEVNQGEDHLEGLSDVPEDAEEE